MLEIVHRRRTRVKKNLIYFLNTLFNLLFFGKQNILYKTDFEHELVNELK